MSTPTTTDTPNPRKVRRLASGAVPPQGWELQKQNRRVRRADASRLRHGQPDPNVTGVGGLAKFNAFSRELGVHRELHQSFGHLKRGHSVVYPMASQMLVLVDAAVVGTTRVFGMEVLASDPLFTHLAGGYVSSVDTLYDDLRRFEAEDIDELERIACKHGLADLAAEVAAKNLTEICLDIDTTVMPLFGEQEGAVPGFNPRYRGRPSYHPLLMRVAETGTIVGARLRPGDTGFGVGDAPDIEIAIDGVREVVGPDVIITTRIDAAGDCADVLSAIDRKGCFFIVKAKQTRTLLGAVSLAKKWTTVDVDADGHPSRQVAEIDFRRESWPIDSRFRAFAVRTTQRDSSRQTCLWADMDHSVQIFFTNDCDRSADELAQKYDLRAGIEPIIGELKHGMGLGKVSTASFDANEVAFLIKILAFNLIKRWMAARQAICANWNLAWIRDLCVRVPGRLLRKGGQWLLRLAPRPMIC